MNMSSRRTYAMGVCMLLVSALALPAQTTGSINGVIADAANKSIAQAIVSIRNEAGGSPKSITTDAEGKFSVPLAEGSYTIEVSAPSFVPSRRTGVKVSASQSADVSMSLNISQLSQTITVEGSVALAAETAP